MTPPSLEKSRIYQYLHALKKLGYSLLPPFSTFLHCYVNKKPCFCNWGMTLEKPFLPKYMEGKKLNSGLIKHQPLLSLQLKQVSYGSKVSAGLCVKSFTSCICIYSNQVTIVQVFSDYPSFLLSLSKLVKWLPN